MAAMMGFDVSALTERFRTWRPNHFRDTTPTEAGSPTPSQNATISPPDSSPIPVPITLPIEESEGPELNVVAQLPTGSGAEEPEEPKAPSVNAFIRYEREELLALRQSPYACCPERLTETSREIQILTDERKLLTRDESRMSASTKTASKKSKLSAQFNHGIMQYGKLLPPKSSSSEHHIAAVRLPPTKSQVAPIKTELFEIINSTLTKSGNSSPGKVSSMSAAPLRSQPSPAQRVQAVSQQVHTVKATTADSSAEVDAAHKGEEDDNELGRIIADMDAAKAEHKARMKERKAAQKAAKALAELADAKAELRHAERKAKAHEEPMCESGDSAQPNSQSTKAPARPSPPSTVPANLSTTGYYCGRCKQEFKSAIHLQVHFEMAAAHLVCDACKKDTNSWKALLLHYKTTGHAIVCKECCQGNGNAFPADGVAYRSHLDVQNVCKTCNLHCGSRDALDEHHEKNSGCQSFNKQSDRSTLYDSSASAIPQKRTEPAARPKSPQTPTPARSIRPKPSGGKALVHQTPPRPTDNYKKELPQYQGPPSFGSMQPREYPQAQVAKSSLSSSSVSFAMPKPLFRAFAGLPKALSEGTAKYAWLEYIEEDPRDSFIRYQTITRIDCYKQWSLEELRYGDYEKGRKYGPVKTSRQELPAQLPPVPAAPPPSRAQAATPSANAQLALTDKIRCWTCDRQFSQICSIIAHLESGACSRGPNHYDFHNVVAGSNAWKEFIYREDRYNMLEYYDWHHEYPFFCPGCGGEFAILSGLISHIESGRCGQRLDCEPILGILDWIHSRVI
ncbi:hypothetical protein BLS_009896 [Venturia inaequalis]|uniref:C2H2-type domain-containing protein n=1 Tax=Venturia inaequalis TaxID=5025 RepID=A0A8H3UZ16_VENIN|nr:hypothetical protein BLS_009896 [Venturia inaequalis]